MARQRLRTLRRRCRRFVRDCRGSLAFETVIVLPMLLTAFLMTVVFYDVFRTENTNAKAAYAVADTLSRRVTPVTPAHLEGLHDLYIALSRARHPTQMRVTSIEWDAPAEVYRVQWSYGTRSTEALTDADLQDMRDRLPMMMTGDTYVLVETRLDYTPPLDIGIGQRRLQHLIPTRPRFAPRLLLLQNGEIS